MSQDSTRIVDPPISALHSLRQPLTQGERQVLDWFLEVLPIGWNIYIQPHLNGLRPDFVLLHPKKGIAVYEIKDWSLQSMDYFINEDKDVPCLMGRRNGKCFSLAKQDPVAKIDQYKQEIFNLYVPSLPSKNGLGSIVSGIIFTNASTSEMENLLSPLRKHYGHDRYRRQYPIIGNDIIGRTDEDSLRKLLNSVYKIDESMSEVTAAELRHWLVEPVYSSEQRSPLKNQMTDRLISIVLNEEGVKFRRIKGPAGSGKSLVLAGRAAELCKIGKRVLIVTYNITLINYLIDLSVRYAQSGNARKQITALNFHYWCKRIACLSGHRSEYDMLWAENNNEQNTDLVLNSKLPDAAARWASELSSEDRWDAILVDEGQDFRPEWWTALRTALPLDKTGEAMLVADAQQNIYGIKPWTESDMSGAGFRGRWLTLDYSYRMSPSLCNLATEFVERFLPDIEDHLPRSQTGEFEFKTVLRWRQIDSSKSAAESCADALIEILQGSSDDPVSVSDLVCLVDKDDIGREIVGILRNKNIKTIHTFGDGEDDRTIKEDSRRKKLTFYKGDARVKVTTVQSFKGWESRALVVQISDASSPNSLSLAYAAITRLKRDDHGCYLTVVCSAPQLADYGAIWVNS